MGRAKGTALLVLVERLQARREEALAALPEALAHYLDRPIATSGWYPEEDMRALARAVVQLSPENESDALGAIGREITRRHKQGVYANLLNRISRLDTQALWATQHDSGKMSVSADGSKGARIELSGFDEPSREICGILNGYIEESLTLRGFVDPVVKKVSCRVDGDETCVWRTSWKAAGPPHD